MRRVILSLVYSIILSLTPPQLLVAGNDCTFNGVDLSYLSGDWQTVGYETCNGCNSNVYLNLSICSPLQDLTCGSNVSVCYMNILLETVTPQGVPAGDYNSRAIEYFPENKTMEITFNYHLQNIQGTTTILLFCGKHLGVPLATDTSIKSSHMLIEWETNALCQASHLIENKCYLVLYDYAYFVPYLYDFTPLIKTKGAYVITQNGDTTRYALNLCQEIVPDSGEVSLSGCEGSVLCRLSDTGNQQLIQTGDTQGMQSLGGVISIQYSSTPADQSNCNGDAILSIFFHCPYEFDISPGPRLVVRDSACYFHVDWYTEHACAQRYTKNEGCVIEGTSNNPFKFDLTPLGENYSRITDGEDIYEIQICSDTGVTCGGRNAQVCLKNGNNVWSLGSDKGEMYYADGELTLTYLHGDICSSGYPITSTFRFVCSQDSSSGPSLIAEEYCSYFFGWPTPLACVSSSTQVGTCQNITYGQSRYDLSYLKRGDESNWVAGIGAYLTTDTNSRFLLNLCGTLNSGGSDQSSAPQECVGYGVCEITDAGSVYGIGKFNNIFARAGNVLVVEYTEGICPTNSEKVGRVNLLIICKIGVTDSSPIYVGLLEECLYEFQWEHTAACPTANHVTYGENCEVRDPATLYTYNLLSLSGVAYSIVSNSYEYQLSICSALGDSASEQCAAAAGCQTKDTSSNSLGAPNSTLSFANGSLQLGYEGGDTCSGGVKRRTLISFACDLATTGIKEVEDPEVSHCSYFFVFYTSRACPFEYLFVDCSYTGSGHTFDLSPLIRQFDNWNGTVISGTTSAISSAKFYLNVCRPVNNVPGCHPLSSACMDIRVGNVTKSASIGKAKTGLKALAGNVHNGLRIVYTEDEPLELAGVCNGINPQTGITFLCPQSSQTRRLDYPRLIGVDTSGCIFEFEWYTELACIETETHVSTPCAVQDPTSGFVLSFLSLEGTTRVLLDDATPSSPFFYLSICSVIDSDILQTSSITSDSAALLVYPNSVSDAKNSSLGRTNSNVFYSDGELIQLKYTQGSTCSSGKKSTLITFVCSHLITTSLSYIGSLLTNNNCLFEFEYKTILACPPVTTECVITSADGLLYDLTRLKQLSKTGFPVSISGQYRDIPESASLRISVCQPLEVGSTTTCTNGSASCLSYDNQIFDLGRVTGDLQLSQQGELQLIYSGGTGCSKGALTVITWRCDRTVGVGQPLLSLHRNMSGSCYYDIVWNSEYACPVLPNQQSGCAVTDPDTGFVYNFTSLSKLPDIQIQPNSTDSTDQYYYTLSICRPISSSCGADGSAMTGACQSYNDRKFVTGLYNSTLTLSDGEVQLVYTGGDTCHSTDVNRTTIIRFYCDKTASSPRAVVLPELTHCLYEILLYTDLACPPSQTLFQCTAYNSENGNSYDLSSLQHRNYFEVSVSDSLVYYFSVCSTLPSSYGDKGVQCDTGTSFCALLKKDNAWKAINLGTMIRPPYLPQDNLIVLYYSTTDAKRNATLLLECIEEVGMTSTNPVLLSHSDYFSSNVFTWRTLAACKSEPSDSCQVVQYATGFTIDLDMFQSTSIESETSDTGGSLAISLCGVLTDSSLGSCYTNNNTAVCLSQGSLHHPIATGDTSKWFYGEDVVVSYYEGYDCLDSSSPFKSSVELTLQCGTSTSLSFSEPVDGCVYQVLWQTPILCQYQVECSVTYNEQTYDLNWLKAFDTNWRVVFNNKKFLINICHNLLPEETQTCDSTAAVCMLTEGKAVSLGQVGAGPEYVGEGQLKIEYENGDECSDGRYSATVMFICEKGADLEDYINQTVDGCHYTFNWATHVACAETNGTLLKLCEIADTVTGDLYNLVPVREVGVVRVHNEPLMDIIACQAIQHRCGDNGGSVCYNNSTSYGIYTPDSLTLKNHVPTLEYKGGSTCAGDTKYESSIEFVCNKSTIGHDYVEHLPIEGCVHYFLWHTPLACPASITECKITLQDKILDLTDLNRKYGAWEVDMENDKLYFNPCAGMSSFLFNTQLTSESCSSDSLACLLQKSTKGLLEEVGSLDTAVLKLSLDGKYPIQTARSQTKCLKTESKTYSVKILFYSSSAMVETPTLETILSCVIIVVFRTSLVGEHSPVNQLGELITSESQDECHDALVKLNKNEDYQIKSTFNEDILEFSVNFCSHTSVAGCKEASVCLVKTHGNANPVTIGLSSYLKRRVTVINESYIELVMSSGSNSCPYTSKPILTVFYISCSSQHTTPSVDFQFTSPTGCLYVFNVLAPDSVCVSYEPTDAPPVEGVNAAGKTAVVFVVVLIACVLGLFLAILITLCFYKRSTKGDRVFYKLRAYLSRTPDVQYRFERLEGSEVGHLITNMSGSESEDETVSEARPGGVKMEPAGLDKFAISDPPTGKEGNGSEDEDFIKL